MGMDYIKIIKDAFDIYGAQYKSLGDYSATTLISPQRVVALTKRHGHKVTPSVESQAASLVGTAVHEKMERLLKASNIANPDYMLERGLVHPFFIGDEMRLVSGRFDIMHREQDLYDIKTAKVWKLVFEPDMRDWHEQQNIYAFLLRMRGIEIQTLNIAAFYLDWIESKALRDKSYPAAPIVQYRLTQWTPKEQHDFILKRLAMHIEAEYMADDDLPDCTEEERWERPAEFAIMKDQNATRAVKLIKKGTFADALEAARKCKGLGANSFIEVRRQQRKRCDKYCLVNTFCNSYQSYLDKKRNYTINEVFPLAEVL